MVNALQRHAAVVVQKSLAEGFGLTVVEAMWKARPVVASAVGGIVDQITDGSHGLLIDDPLDLAAFGRAIRRILETPKLAATLGEGARERAGPTSWAIDISSSGESSSCDRSKGNAMSDDEARLEPLTHEECLELLRAGGVGRIGSDVDEFPVILPVNYRLVETSGRVSIRCRRPRQRHRTRTRARRVPGRRDRPGASPGMVGASAGHSARCRPRRCGLPRAVRPPSMDRSRTRVVADRRPVRADRSAAPRGDARVGVRRRRGQRKGAFVLRSVALPTEHGGWGLTLEPALLGLLVAPSWAGACLAAAAFVAFLVRTPLKTVLVDRYRRRRLEHGVADRVVVLEAISLRRSRHRWSRDGRQRLLGCRDRIAARRAQLGFDMRSRSRRLVPELAGAVGISAVVAMIVLADGGSGHLRAALWLILAARVLSSIPWVPLQIAGSTAARMRRALVVTDLVASALAVRGGMARQQRDSRRDRSRGGHRAPANQRPGARAASRGPRGLAGGRGTCRGRRDCRGRPRRVRSRVGQVGMRIRRKPSGGSRACGSRRNFQSTMVAPSSDTTTGLQSNSATSGTCSASRPTRSSVCSSA